jgi:hypothetical protein
VAALTVELHGHQAVLHHDVYRIDKTLLAEMRGHLEDIKPDLAAEGVTQMLVMTDYDRTKLHYWHLMGFEAFFAVQEV